MPYEYGFISYKLIEVFLTVLIEFTVFEHERKEESDSESIFYMIILEIRTIR
jgi:hypothetical protein